MECEVCLENLDVQKRRPKFLPCGHTVCERCIHRLRDRLCPQCRKALPRDLSTLPDNYYVLSQLQQSAHKSSRRRWWCVNCSRVASRSCEESHTIQNLRAAFRNLVKDVMPTATEKLTDVCPDDCNEEQILSALNVLGDMSAAGSSWHVTVESKGAGTSYSVSWESSNDDHSVLKALLLVQSVRGRIKMINEEKGAEKTVVATKVVQKADLKLNSLSAPSERLDSKSYWLATIKAQGVRRLSHVYCHVDPNWTLEVIQAAVPTVENMQLLQPHAVHLFAALTAPHLKRLTVTVVNEAENDYLYMYDDPPLADAFSLGHHGGNTLEMLTVKGSCGLPRDTLVAILRQHSASLQELYLDVGTSRNGPVLLEDWPRKCAILHEMLENCHLTALKKLVLLRSVDDVAVDHSKPHCKKQLDKLRAALPRVEVLCDSVLCGEES